MINKECIDLEIEKWDSNEIRILEKDKDLKVLENKFNKFLKNRKYQNFNIKNTIEDIQITDALQRKINSLSNLV